MACRKERFDCQREFDKELHEKRMEELELRKQIAAVDLETAQYLSVAQKRKADLEVQVLEKRMGIKNKFDLNKAYNGC